ncbi:hypothetical protein [Alkalihalobacillus pseudalcaliphilus]|uniref:hypothetical protein n=1 Tax=Alkalihalobacillus pseudalcaliphilus TaxID=79884 RepID=UPI00064E0C34|nr:hypothetical protein [Alkalihalobacillus pseudalcaliphilus]KMK75781.1 hypothetical protein AB990_10965 [Alkalihalobacillus pseudalcaliphilus]
MSSINKQISIEQAALEGVSIDFEQMNNGEKRFRLLHSEGSSYCLTIASKDGAWQNSHYHKNALEVYVVDQGWVVYASLQGGNLDMKIVKEGEHILVPQGVHHNIYMSEHSKIHTIKLGQKSDEIDWYGSEQLDLLTKNVSEIEIKRWINNVKT